VLEPDPAPDGEGIRIICGQEIGTIRVTCELWDQQPPLDADSWQDIAEISARWTSAFLDFGTTAQDDPACRLSIPAPGAYRFRIHGTHRDGDDPRPATAPGFSVKFSVLKAATARPLFRPGLGASTATVGHHRGMRGQYPTTTDVTGRPRGRRLGGQRAALRCCRRSGGRPQPSRAGSSRRRVG